MRVFAKMANELTSLRNINRGIERKFLTTAARTRMYLCRKVETHEKYSGDTLVYQRKTEAEKRDARTVESRRVGETRSHGKWQSGRTRVSEFSMESANDKIRARPFRHTKFQDVSRPVP